MAKQSESCQNCGRLIFMDGLKAYDDVASGPYVTEGGDLYCIPCGREMDRAERLAAEEDYPESDFDPYDGED